MKKVILAVFIIGGVLAAQQFFVGGPSGKSRVEKLTDKELADYDSAYGAAQRAADHFNQVLKSINRAHHVLECPSMTTEISAFCKSEYSNIHGDWLVIDGY